MTRPDRRVGWTVSRAALVLTTLAALVSCGLPGEERTRSVDDQSVPYNLLEPQAPTGEAPSVEAPTANPALPRMTPVVYWLAPDDRLTPAPVSASCDDSSAEVVEAVLRALVASPTAEQRSAGWASAIPPSARLDLVGIDDGVARVDLDPLALGDPERLPLAVGQLVLSVTSAPEVDALQMVTSGDVVEVPLPGGALAAGPVTADDYVRLLPRRAVANRGTTEVPTGGCSAPR